MPTTPSSPMPQLVHVTSADGTPLRADLYEPAPDAGPLRAQVVVVHGYCEHRGRYRHVAQHLTAHGYRVLVGDLRGHGESAGERGYVERFVNYVDDLDALRQSLEKSAPKTGTPLSTVVLGHSMGGLVALAYLLARPSPAAVALSAPFLGIKLKVPGWKRSLGLLASMLHPTLKLPNEIPATAVSHDPEVVRLYETDPLITHNATARWFTETVSTQDDVMMRANRIKTPLLMQVAGADQIVDAAAAEKVFELLGSSEKTKLRYDSLYHEIFNEREPDRQKVLDDLTSWLDARFPAR